MKTNQKSLIGDDRGESDILIILVSIAIVLALVAGGLILLIATPYLQGFQRSIGIPENSQLPTAADFASSFGWWLLIAGIGILVVMVLIWYFQGGEKL